MLVAGIICSKCNGPRELDSSSASWCKECIRTYHRERYRTRMKAAGKVVVPRRQEEARNTPEGFDDFVTVERQQSKARIQFINDLRSAPIEAAMQLLGAEPCDCCDRRILTKENCYPIAKEWFLYDGDRQQLTPVTDVEDDRAVHLIAAVVCKDCHDVIRVLQAIPDLRKKMAFLQTGIQGMIPVEAEVPTVVRKQQRPPDTSSSPSPAPTYKPIGPPVYQEEPPTPTPIVYKVPPNWHELSDEDLIAVGPEAFEGRLEEASAQWYEDWVYHMSYRGIIMEDDLFDEDFAEHMAKKTRDEE